jgi:hypothetical protein
MSKTKILAFSALLAMLFSCGSQDGGPPELKKTTIDRISPFDTLVVEFNSDIVDIDKLDSSNIIADNATLVPGKAISKELRFVGKNKTDGGFFHFYAGEEGSITFKNLKNTDGYVKDNATVKFSTHPTLEIEANDTEESANSINDSLARREVGYTFAGIIDKDVGTGTDGRRIFDLDDYYKLDLKFNDVITISASNRSAPFTIRFYGPCYYPDKTQCNDTTITVTKTGILENIKIIGGHLEPGSGTNFETPASFYIHVSDPISNTPPNPYLLNVKVK